MRRTSFGLAIAAMTLAVLAPVGNARAQKGPPPPEVVKELAPDGKLRAAINLANAVLVQEDPAGGDPKGITVDLARELARRLGVQIELVIFRGAGTVFAAAKSGRWNVSFFAIEPARATEVDFTPPYVLIEGGYVVPKNSPIRAIADVDRPGVRVAVGQGSAYDLFLTRTLKNAQLIRGTVADRSYRRTFIDEKLDAMADVKPAAVVWTRDRPGMRVLDGAFMEIRQAMGMPKGRGQATSRYLRDFVEEMKASGFVAAALSRSGQADAAMVAPPATN